MKILSFLILTTCFSSLAFGQQLTYVPDNQFEAYIEENITGSSDGTAQNNYVLTAALQNVVTVYIHPSDYVISDFTGIEDFDTVTQITLMGQEMDSLDLSHITVTGGGGSVLHISSCQNLEGLKIPKGEIFQTLITLNSSLKDLTFQSSNVLYSTTISFCDSLDSIDLSIITEFQLDGSLSISTNPNLEYCNLSNGTCINISSAGFTDTPKLHCIIVDDPVYCENSFSWPSDDASNPGFIYNYIESGDNCSDIAGINVNLPDNASVEIVKYYDLLGRERNPDKVSPGEVILEVTSDGEVTKKVYYKN
ncbi:MAG: hypothetical protein WED10_05730 [Brumimicrobium sp.]